MKYLVVLITLFVLCSCGNEPSAQSSKNQEDNTNGQEILSSESDGAAGNNAQTPAQVTPKYESLDENGDYSKLDALAPHFGDDMEYTDLNIAKQLLKETENFIKKYPSDKRAPVALVRAGGVSRHMGEWMQAQQFFRQAWTDYPDTYAAPMALFHDAYIADQVFEEKAKALEMYNIFLARYPTNSFSPEIQKLKDMLFLTKDEYIQKAKIENQ